MLLSFLAHVAGTFIELPRTKRNIPASNAEQQPRASRPSCPPKRFDDRCAMDSSNIPFFLKAAVAAFLSSSQALAAGAARILSPFIDEGYRQSSVPIVVLGETVHIPTRIHFLELDENKLQIQSAFLPTIGCFCTRSTDGYLRQSSLRCILSISEPWSIPFVVLLAAEYVVENIEEMVASLSSLDREAYINFVRENRDLMRLLRSKATSYWDRYYRASHPDRSIYSGLAFLHQLELWAS
jgi:hypothetical protein